MKDYLFMPEEFQPRLHDLMKEKNIKAKTMCREMGISSTTAYEWINDTRVPNTVYFFKLCKFFNVNPLYLYGMTNERGTYET